MPNISKQLWKEFSNKHIKAYIVDGTAVRQRDIRFTMGGHWLVYDYVPKGEVWIAEELNDFDRRATLLHELREIENMGKGLSYDEAHEIANKIESQARKTGNVDEVLKKEFSRHTGIVVEPTFYNHVKHAFVKGYDLTKQQMSVAKWSHYKNNKSNKVTNKSKSLKIVQ